MTSARGNAFVIPVAWFSAIGVFTAAATGCFDAGSGIVFPWDEQAESRLADTAEFRFDATLTSNQCALGIEPTPQFSFAATLLGLRAPPEVTLRLGDQAQPATFDGQVLVSNRLAVRAFPACVTAEGVACSTTQMAERLEVVLLSRSQAVALDGGCQPGLLDGGVPFPDADAGIEAPGMTERGFDAARACGVLIDQVLPGDECLCRACAVFYDVRGERR